MHAPGMVLPTWDMHALRRADCADDCAEDEVDDASTNADESDEAELPGVAMLRNKSKQDDVEQASNELDEPKTAAKTEVHM